MWQSRQLLELIKKEERRRREENVLKSMQKLDECYFCYDSMSF